MTHPRSCIDDALAAIKSASLTPTEHLILEQFVTEAVNSECAAQYVLETIGDSSSGVEVALRKLKMNWKRLVERLTDAPNIPSTLTTLIRHRDGPYCCMTNAPKFITSPETEPAHIIPPTLFEDQIKYNEIKPLMEAFLTKHKISELRSILEDKSDHIALSNTWLLSPSLHKAFRYGQVRILPRSNPQWEDKDERLVTTDKQSKYILTTLWPEECTNLRFSDKSLFQGPVHLFTVKTSDLGSYPLPNPRLLRAHYRFAAALHLFYVEECIAKGWPQPSRATLSPKSWRTVRRFWQLIPKPVRIFCYRILEGVGERLYGGTISPLTQRLPLGLYLKKYSRSQGNEPNVLRILEQKTSVPAPTLIDTFDDKESKYMIMTGISGQMLCDVFHRMSYPERDQLVADLREIAGQLRSIPNRTPYLFANTLGGPIIDHRLPDGNCKPCHAETEFNSHLIHKHVGKRTKDLVEHAHSRNHRAFLSHCDLNPTNILIEQGRLSGIVDWECASYVPEYWEFTKAMYGVWGLKDDEMLMRRAFDDGYEDELLAEQALWRVTPLGL